MNLSLALDCMKCWINFQEFSGNQKAVFRSLISWLISRTLVLTLGVLSRSIFAPPGFNGKLEILPLLQIPDQNADFGAQFYKSYILSSHTPNKVQVKLAQRGVMHISEEFARNIKGRQIIQFFENKLTKRLFSKYALQNAPKNAKPATKHSLSRSFSLNYSL